MFNKRYIKEFLDKIKWWEPILITILFTISIYVNIISSGAWWIKTIMIGGTIFSVLAVWHRLHRFKQDYVFSLISNILVGISLGASIYVTYDLFKNCKEPIGPVITQIILTFQYGFIFTLFTIAGFGRLNEKNVVPAEEKFLSKELIMSTGIFILSLGFLMLIVYPFQMNLEITMLLIGMSFGVSAITTLYLFRWNYTFLFWQLSNVFSIIFFIQIESYPILLLSCMYVIVDAIVFVEWKLKK